jgi:hypothetical protein
MEQAALKASSSDKKLLITSKRRWELDNQFTSQQTAALTPSLTERTILSFLPRCDLVAP